MALETRAGRLHGELGFALVSEHRGLQGLAGFLSSGAKLSAQIVEDGKALVLPTGLCCSQARGSGLAGLCLLPAASVPV